MSARQIIVPGAMPSRDANGRALPAKFRFYVPGATLSTPKTVYTDSTLSVPHPFPILSDSAGRWPQIWADESQSFDVGWTDQTFDQIIAGPFTGVSPADDAVLASVDLSESAADEATAAAAEALVSAASAAASAAAAAASSNGFKVVATSLTPNTIASGTHVFTLDQADTDFAATMDVLMADNAAPAANRMIGNISSLVGNVLTVVVPVGGTTGSGSHSSWTISLTYIGGVVSIAGLVGVISAAAAKAALAIASTDITDFTNAVDDEAVALAVAL